MDRQSPRRFRCLVKESYPSRNFPRPRRRRRRRRTLFLVARMAVSLIVVMEVVIDTG